jgi:hypothetical protein
MGATPHTSGGGNYYTVADGKLIKRVKEPTAFSKERTTKTGKQVHEEFYKDVSGRIVSATLKEGEYGKDWQIRLEDADGEASIVTMRHGSRYVTDLGKKLPNIDMTQQVWLAPYDFVDSETGKRRSGFTITQGGPNKVGRKIESAYTKDSAEQLPQMQQVRIKGQMVWDSTDLDEAIDALIVKYCGGVNAQFAAPVSNNNSSEEAPF